MIVLLLVSGELRPADAQLEIVGPELTFAGNGDIADVATDDTGRFLVAWWTVDAAGQPVFARLFDREGAALGPRARLSGPERGDIPEVAGRNGRFAVTWIGPTSDREIYLARLEDEGWQVATVDHPHRGGGAPTWSEVGIADDGAMTLAWTAIRERKWRIFVQLLNAQGRPRGNSFAYAGRANEVFVGLEVDRWGRFVLARLWRKEREARRLLVHPRRRNGDSRTAQQVVWDLPRVEWGPPVIAMNDEGDFAVVFRRRESILVAQAEVLARFYDRSGEPLGPTFRVDTPDEPPIEGQDWSTAALDAWGNLVVAYRAGEPGEARIVARVFHSDGRAVGEPVWVSEAPLLGFGTVRLALDSEGRVLVAWDRFDMGRMIMGRALRLTCNGPC